MSVLGENLKSYRKRAGLSIRALEELSGVSRNVISKIEAGENNNPTITTLEKLAKSLGVSIETLTDMETDHEYVITDIEEAMNVILSQENLMLHGELLSDEAKIQLANSIKMALSFAEQIQKNKKE